MSTKESVSLEAKLFEFALRDKLEVAIQEVIGGILEPQGFRHLSINERDELIEQVLDQIEAAFPDIMLVIRKEIVEAKKINQETSWIIDNIRGSKSSN